MAAYWMIQQVQMVRPESYPMTEDNAQQCLVFSSRAAALLKSCLGHQQRGA